MSEEMREMMRVEALRQILQTRVKCLAESTDFCMEETTPDMDIDGLKDVAEFFGRDMKYVFRVTSKGQKNPASYLAFVVLVENQELVNLSQSRSISLNRDVRHIHIRTKTGVHTGLCMWLVPEHHTSHEMNEDPQFDIPFSEEEKPIMTSDGYKRFLSLLQS